MKLCPFVPPGHLIPDGLSHSVGRNGERIVRLTFALWAWPMRRYDIARYEWFTGWWRLRVRLQFTRDPFRHSLAAELIRGWAIVEGRP